MHSYVTKILVPYFNKHKKRLNHLGQCCIWLIDVWSVHRSQAFQDWMKEKYSWIIIFYIPGGHMGIWQPSDVGIQRLLKLAIKCSCHADIVAETLLQLHKGVSAETVQLQKTIGVLQDRSVQWLVNGYEAINRKDLVKKVCSDSLI
ncbi:hypothetical protein JAAARDRAFT_133764 [Jaapia argillacea MUCL 33604]|uniref:DDE-1 domain-containing protein n=1 Tax=Jaapia argillacea MUCL 33604 TaxID=933084 RepID=A0A067PNZ9_9AGAM|nr:hypothetical protein JAAARDRAFT_133764 [Jaapia argillacea MUCL 33604]